MTFSLLGVKFKINYLFTALVVIYIAFDKTGMILLLFLSILVHELSHVIFIYLFKSKVNTVNLILGAVSVEYADICSKTKKIIALIAGPISNLFLSYIGMIIENEKLCALNIVLAVYNLLPIISLDGGAILNEILTIFVDVITANKILQTISLLLSVLGIIVWFTAFRNNLSLMIVLIYIATPLIFKKTLKDKRL